MSFPYPMTAGEANALINNIISRTRPVLPAELYQALNFGVSEAVKSLSATRPQFFASFVDPFTIGGGQIEYDISSLSPSLFRPWRLVCTGNSGQSSVVLFRYAAQTSQEFEDAEVSTAGAVANQLLYDVMDGLLPNGTVTLVSPAAALATTLTFPSPLDPRVTVGGILTFPNAGDVRTPQGWSLGIADDYNAYVVSTNPGAGQVTVQPPVPGPGPLPGGSVGTIMRRKILRIVPALQQTYTGRLWYVYTPTRLRVDADPLPASLSERYIDMVVDFGVGLLKRAVDDSMEARWALQGVEKRAELLQDSEPVSGQNSEALGSALDWMGY